MNRSRLVVIFITIFIDLVSFGIVIPLLPFYAQNFGASGTTIGLLLSVFSLTAFLFMPVWGRLSDRYGRRPIMLITLVLSGISYVIFSFATSLWMLFVARVLAGVGNANISVAQAYISDVTTAENRAKGMGLVGAAFGLGFVFGPLIGGVFSSDFFGEMKYALPGWIAAGLSFSNSVLAYVILKESLSDDLRSVEKNQRFFDFEALQRALLRRNLSLLIGMFFIVTVGFSSMFAAFPLFIMEPPFKLSSSEMGWFFVEIGIVSVIVQGGLIGLLTKRFSERALINTGTILMAVGFASFPVSNLMPFGNIAILIAATAMISLGSSLLAPPAMSLASKFADPAEQGSTLGIVQSIGSLGRMVGPTVGGAAYDFAGHNSPYYFSCILMVTAALMSAELLKREIAVS